MLFKQRLNFIALFILFLSPLVHADVIAQKIIAIQQAKIEVLQKKLNTYKEKIRNEVLVITPQWCGGKQYNCSIRSCIDLCASKGGRVAHRHELANIALKGQNHCAYTISFDTANNRFDAGYPMYNFQGGGCHNSTNVPSISTVAVPSDPNVVFSANCGCMEPVSLD